ncbi:MAG: serine hydrolase [Candidatus Marinimicrobia bacterium]|nr:serine hydrolase [Candidatus Neomarinimicrobiota bacterium]
MLFRMNSILSACLLLIFLFPSVMQPQEKADQIDEIMDAYNENRQFNGSVLVAEHGDVLFKGGYGLANMEWDIPNTPDTKHRIGSVTKQFTAMLILQLAEEDKLDLHAPILTYLPDFREETGKQITTHHLLIHSSGLPNYTSTPNFRELTRQHLTIQEMVQKYAQEDLEFEPGARFAYSNTGYLVLGAIIEKITGNSYETELQQRILEPVGMDNSGYDHNSYVLEKRASGYDKVFTGYENTEFIDMTIPHAAGAMYSTVEDLFKWDRSLYNNKLLPRKWMQEYFEPRISTGRGEYAFGWFISNWPTGTEGDSVKVIEHGGGINGFNAGFVRLVRDEHTIILLNNTGGTILNEISRKIIRILYGNDYEVPVTPVTEILRQSIIEHGVEKAKSLYLDLRAEQEKKYEFNPSQLNSLGYQLMGAERYADAIEIFKLNVETYPENANAYDSLGEAYMNDGQTDLAIKNYARSLELNPDNTNAVNMLEKLQQD